MVVKGGPPITAWIAMPALRAFLLVPIGDGRLYCYADPTDGVFDRFADLFRDFHQPVGSGLPSARSPVAAEGARLASISTPRAATNV